MPSPRSRIRAWLRLYSKTGVISVSRRKARSLGLSQRPLDDTRDGGSLNHGPDLEESGLDIFLDSTGRKEIASPLSRDTLSAHVPRRQRHQTCRIYKNAISLEDFTRTRRHPQLILVFNEPLKICFP